MRNSMKKSLILFLFCSLSFTGYGTDSEESTSYKKLFMDKVAVPLYMQYDRIKDEGPSKTDLFVLGVGISSLYGLKKTADHYHLFSFDLEKSRKVLSQDWHRITEHKGKIALTAGGLCLLAFVVKKGLEMPIIQRLKRSFNKEQKELITSDEKMGQLVDKASDDPKALAEHQEFTGLLNDEQKELLDRAVEEKKADEDPMSLFDDFGD